MTITADGAHGPIDFVLIEFPPGNPDGAAAGALAELIDAGTIRLLDLVVVHRGVDDTVTVIDVDGAGDTSFVQFSGARSGLIGDDDVAQAGDAMTPGSTAALIVFENAWAAPFVAAVRSHGGELVASMRIPAQDVIDALDALESTESR
ncbi:MAG TPA: DUF6325 family protein [Ornithinibacter sp.]|nr:DUF6325 family protein [Ornithinibacter sp.]